MQKQKRNLPCFIQVNTAEEPQKGGITPDGSAGFLAFCGERRLDVRGLMCIPPISDAPGPHFALPELSMGMSADYEAAIALGAKYIRLGTAMLGERDGTAA